MYPDASYDASGGGLDDFNGLCIGWFGEPVSHAVLQGINPEGKNTLIYELEVLAAVLGCELLLSTLRPCDIVLFTGSEAALSALICGRSDCAFVQHALNRLFDLEEDRSLNVWFERVCSANNPADAPSTGSYLLLDFPRHRSSVSRVLSEFCASSTGAPALDSSELPAVKKKECTEDDLVQSSFLVAMTCLTKASQTPLQHFATSLVEAEELAKLFPMYTTPLEVLLQMSEVKPHEELLQEGSLSIFDDAKGKAMFVSHQWLTKLHPDPEFKQFPVLQQAIRNIRSGATRIRVEAISEFTFGSKEATSVTQLLAESNDIFVWYDYFSCPQLEHKLKGEAWLKETAGGELRRAVDSIPAYITHCQVFLALCPVVASADGVSLGPSTWNERGWCRVEQMMRELSPGSGAWVIVKSAMHLEVKFLGRCSPGEGEFTVEGDRARVAPILRDALRSKLLACLRSGQLSTYRLFLNDQASRFRGLPAEPVGSLVSDEREGDEVLQDEDESELLVEFFRQNGFRRALERDAMGWSPICYAALQGDPRLIAGLLAQRASPNDEVKKAWAAAGLSPRCPVLSICISSGGHDSMKILLEARACADVKGIQQPPILMACAHNDTKAIQMLCHFGGNPFLKQSFGWTPINICAAFSKMDSLEEMIRQQGDAVDLSSSLIYKAAIMGSSLPCISRLIDARADLNEQYEPSATDPLGLLMKLKGLQYRISKVPSIFSTVGYHHYGSTPLMVGIMCGNFETAVALIMKKARLDLKNVRDKTAIDLAHELQAPDYLVSALQEPGSLEARQPVGKSMQPNDSQESMQVHHL
ncbi:Ank3 [Symbiodinium sp. CCMP2592]|nr:Ank3 [Symbiodinium sp. CCMP2592]